MIRGPLDEAHVMGAACHCCANQRAVRRQGGLMDTPEDVVLGQATFGSGGGIDWYRPDGIYPVDLVALTTQTSRNKFRDNELQTQLLWEFRPAGYDGPGTLRWWTSFSTHEK